MRKLASIQKILEINPIPGADAIEVASVLGWKVVVKKGEFKPGDYCVYCEIDSVLPDKPEFEFLRKNNFRIKTVRLRKQISQGICFPLDIIPEDIRYTLKEGDEVTDAIGVVKYEVPVAPCMRGKIKGKLPGHTPKTDETRVQADPGLIKEFMGLNVYTSVKVDGTSSTFSMFEGDLDVCGRNWSFYEDPDNIYWKMYHKYNFKEIFEKKGNISIQGEIAGPGIQKNRLGLSKPELFVFNVYDLNKSKRLGFFEMRDFCKKYGLQMVPIWEHNLIFDYTLEELLEKAKGKYEGTKNHREGLVIRPMEETFSEILGGRLSMKVINNDFLLGGGD